MGLVLAHHWNPEQDNKLALWKSLGEVFLICFSDSHIGETTHGSEYTAAVNTVADRERAAEVEGVAKSGKIADISDEFPSYLHSPDKRVEFAVRGSDAEKYLAVW